MYYYIAAIVLVFYLHLRLVSASQSCVPGGATAVLLHLGIPCSYLLEWLFSEPEWTGEEIAGAGLIFITNISIVTLRLLNYIK